VNPSTSVTVMVLVTSARVEYRHAAGAAASVSWALP